MLNASKPGQSVIFNALVLFDCYTNPYVYFRICFISGYVCFVMFETDDRSDVKRLELFFLRKGALE